MWLILYIITGAPYDDNGRIINGEAAGEGEFPVNAMDLLSVHFETEHN